MSDYQNPTDQKYARTLLTLAPAEAKSFLAFKETAEKNEGHLNERERELISLAVALSSQCAYCIDVHVKNSVRTGATKEEIAEVVFLTAAVKAGAAVGHGLLAMKLLDT